MVSKIEINLDHRGNTGDGLNPLKQQHYSQ